MKAYYEFADPLKAEELSSESQSVLPTQPYAL
jgi:hypothetical protein